MKLVKKIVAVTLVTAFCIVSMCPSASAVTVNSEFSVWDYFNADFFVPSPDFPTAESLPYGADTMVVEIFKKISTGYEYVRVYIERKLSYSNNLDIYNGTTALFSATATDTINDFNFQFISFSPIYYQRWSYGSDYYTFEFSPIVKVDNPQDLPAGKVYSTSVIGKLNTNPDTLQDGQFSPTIRSNTDSLMGGRFTKDIDVWAFPNAQRFPYIRDSDIGYYLNYSADRRYPTSSDLQSMRDKITNDKLDGIHDSINSGLSDIEGSIDEAVTRIEGAINEGVSDIIGAGQELPTVDTNNDWMKDSVTKVNEWLSQLEDFEQQMDDNLESNRKNMNSAREFLLFFFDSLPAGLIACLSLGLVMIVVVKIIGR